ncbi:MAG: hypothetical protein JJT87_19430 [Halomonas sp.]|nr:hypothetical protein [Halomonas sp.]MCC5904089.1 hypothetical protein [Halomonas sp.]
MNMTTLPNRERWTGWVTFAWVLAVLAIVGGIALIVAAGFIEVPRQSSFGSIGVDREVNVFVWAIAIGQAVSACMLAALFSMINSIYQNSCDQIAAAIPSSVSEDVSVATPTYTQPNDDAGPKVVKITDMSPLFDKAYVDWFLTEINGAAIAVSKDIKTALRPGENNFIFTKPNGEQTIIIAAVSSDLRLYMTLSR